MGLEYIDIDRADNESGPHIHPSISLQSLVHTRHATTFTETGQHYGSTSSASESEWTPGVREWLVTTYIAILVTMDSFNATIIIPLVPNLSLVLAEPLENALWLNTAYMLANAASQALLGMLAEGLGHGPVLLGAVVLATVGTGVCGGSPSLPGLLVGRFIQGVGGGGITSISLLIIADIIPRSHQSLFASYMLRAQVVGTVLGPVLGGLFVEYAAWIWVFYSSFVFCALGMLVVPFAVDLRGYGPAEGHGMWMSMSTRKLRRMDWIGGSLTFVSLGSLAVGISWAGTQFRWDEWQTLVPICIGVALTMALVLYEAIRKFNVLFSPAVFRSLTGAMLQVGGFSHGLMISTHLQFLPVYLLHIKSLSPAMTGLSLASLTALTLPCLFLFQKTPAFQTNPSIAVWSIRAGWIITILCTGCFVVLDKDTPTVAWVFIFLAGGVGHAVLLPGYASAIRNVTPKYYYPDREGWRRGGRKIDSVSSLTAYYLLRTWGMCLAIPVGGCVFLNQVAQSLDRQMLDGSTRDVPMGGIGAADKHVYVDGLRSLWKVFTGISGLGVLSSVFL
ncbi:hypothetical protein FE257_001214 [Aspergillus nanangensis]|uniref:Major facilitator superfamily (MFS) profile domain-containing protein n=1 Tax=Aspergillus nanangensis TaxID=2582783 RepID=A0AAD4CEJ1_ASPNN|nr:hypothetical protein FE257_001214 [Aspergillus nanangensis]